MLIGVRRGGIESLFGVVVDLPANFNRADSAAEAYRSVEGLKQPFAKSCKIVVQDPHPNPRKETESTGFCSVLHCDRKSIGNERQLTVHARSFVVINHIQYR